MPRPLVVFADDWGRHPSSCQHLVRHLLGGRRVVWVNTIGTRPPRLDLGTAKRVAGKLREWAGLTLTPPRPLSEAERGSQARGSAPPLRFGEGAGGVRSRPPPSSPRRCSPPSPRP